MILELLLDYHISNSYRKRTLEILLNLYFKNKIQRDHDKEDFNFIVDFILI